mmetsp:Transcript_22462/g.55577  ORF Transcript_22462/g.55577 Transcript_22462/m.55577 type:complete len:233 (-) Transcript_22462:153-851(-)
MPGPTTAGRYGGRCERRGAKLSDTRPLFHVSRAAIASPRSWTPTPSLCVVHASGPLTPCRSVAADDASLPSPLDVASSSLLSSKTEARAAPAASVATSSNMSVSETTGWHRTSDAHAAPAPTYSTSSPVTTIEAFPFLLFVDVASRPPQPLSLSAWTLKYGNKYRAGLSPLEMTHPPSPGTSRHSSIAIGRVESNSSTAGGMSFAVGMGASASRRESESEAVSPHPANAAGA